MSNAAAQIAAEVAFRALEQEAAANALAVERIFRQIAEGDLSAETDAAADALFDAGEAIAAKMLALEPLLASPAAIAA